ncbi:MAG: hypothetical protein F6K08_32030 [Okeania sp. SIO1H6]|nr:hypothetical protein [Okeania sp. SIO1H6]
MQRISPCRFFGASQDDYFSLFVNNSDRFYMNNIDTVDGVKKFSSRHLFSESFTR